MRQDTNTGTVLTQDFLRSGGTLDALASLGISVKRHREFTNLCFLKYSQINRPMDHPIVQECRGLILDEADGWRVMSFPFRKFFNHGESNAVVCDANFNRVKIKSLQYVALSHMKEGMSPRRMLEVVKMRESDEFLTYFPEMRPLYDRVANRWSDACEHLERQFVELSKIESQKDFAAAALKTECSSALFSRRAGKVKSMQEFFAKCSATICEGVILSGMDALSTAGKKETNA